jgi:GNAT superfamily N-acetyltransferase
MDSPTGREVLRPRAALPGDAEAIEALRIATWKVAYRGLLPDAYLAALRPASGDAMEARRQRLKDPPFGAGCLLIEGAMGLEGFVNFGPSRDPDAAGAGEIYAAYVDSRHWGTGRGRVLIQAALDGLARAGFAVVTLWVLRGNQRAIRAYQAAGFLPDGSVKSVFREGATLDELRLRRG